MLSILISIIISIIVYGSLSAAQVKSGTTIFFGIFSLFAGFYLVSFFVRKRVTKVQNELQEIMTAGQQRMNRKIQQFQSKPNGNIKLIQRQIEAEQQHLIKAGLDFIPRLAPFKKWSLLMERQMATMRLQFHYQMKEFDQVDAILADTGLLKGPMMMEPLPVAMKMARQYKNKDIAGAEKTFNQKIRWFRGDRGTLLYGLMSWIYVKEGETEKARQLLNKAREATAHDTFTQNWERLCNDRIKSFSNTGLGDEWFGLHLEKPPAPKQQRMRASAQKGRRF